MMRRSPLFGPKFFFIFLAVFGAAVWVVSSINDRKRQLSFVPETMNVSRILYVSEETSLFSFHPSGRGIIVYEMPEALVQQLTQQGPGFLKRHTGVGNDDPRRRYWWWEATPRMSHASGFLRVESFLEQHDNRMETDADITSLTNDALGRPGSFYSQNDVGSLLLIPGAARIVFFYRD